MRILCVADQWNGPKYHRFMPYKFLKAHFTSVLTEELFKNYDIVVIHHNITVPAYQLSEWKKRYSTLLVMDMDDCWDYPKTLPNYPLLEKERFNSFYLSLLADLITVSTAELRDYLKLILGEKDFYITPNYLPYHTSYDSKYAEFKQFKIKEENNPNLGDFLHVGLLGSMSHLEDYTIIKNDLKKILSLPNVILHVIEYNHPKFKFIFNSLPQDRIVYSHPRDVNAYMTLYENVDVIICPLEPSTYNECKSSLKIFESFVHGNICVVDSLYRTKSDYKYDHPHVYYENNDNWFDIIKILPKDRNTLNKIKSEIKSAGIGQMDRFRKRIELLEFKLQYCLKNRTSWSNEMLNLGKASGLYTIFYEDNQKIDFLPIKNKVNSIEEKSYLFEHGVILKHVPKINAPYIGFFSHKFFQKTGLNQEFVIWALNKADIVSFCPPLNLPYLKFTETHHIGFYSLFKEVCSSIGLKVPKMTDDIPTIYGSFFVTKSEIYKDYVENCLKPAIDYIENCPHRHQFFIDSGYKGLESKILREKTGLDYYPMITFILERLISVYVWNEKLSYKNYYYGFNNLNYKI